VRTAPRRKFTGACYGQSCLCGRGRNFALFHVKRTCPNSNICSVFHVKHARERHPSMNPLGNPQAQAFDRGPTSKPSRDVSRETLAATADGELAGIDCPQPTGQSNFDGNVSRETPALNLTDMVR
jgi:hypothetical protein